MVDGAKVREFYFNPPPDDPSRIPGRAELWARYERQRVEDCLLRGGDPAREGLGEHGRLVGGPDKPMTVFSVRPERALPCAPLPLAWYDYPAAREPWPPLGGIEGARAFMRSLSGAYLAGLRNRPSGTQLEGLFRAATLTDPESYFLRHIFTCIRPAQFTRLLLGSGLSVYEVARAVHNSGTHRALIAIWLGGHALRPWDVVGEEHWRELKRAKDEAWAREGGRGPVRGATGHCRSNPSPEAAPGTVGHVRTGPWSGEAHRDGGSSK